ncbi:MAG: hypothetical protein ACK559_00115, partial [bacterium]
MVQQHPRAYAHGTGEVRNAGTCGDEQVERRQHPRRGLPIGDRADRAGVPLECARRRSLMQREPLHVAAVDQRTRRGVVQRSLGVAGELRIPRPHDAHAATSVRRRQRRE